MKSKIFVVLNALVAILALFNLASVSKADVGIDNDLYQIEHSIDFGEFVPIGHVNLRLLKQSQNAAQYQNLESLEGTNEKPNNNNNQPQSEKFLTELETFKLDTNQIGSIEKASKGDSNSMYHVRMCKKVFSNQKCFTSTFTYLKKIIDSNMSFQLNIHTGIDNNLNSISIKPWTTPLLTKQRKQSSDRISVYANVQNMRPASVPDTESYLEKLRIEKEQKEKAAQGGNESFLSKYWMYIVPFVVVMFLMSIVNPEGGAAPGGR